MSDRERLHHIVDALPIERVNALLTLLDEDTVNTVPPGPPETLMQRLTMVPAVQLDEATAARLRDAVRQAEEEDDWVSQEDLVGELRTA